MLDYVEKQTKELLEVFLDEPVVLVEIMSNMPEFNGKICAISRHSSGFVSLNELLKQGLETDETFSFGVSVRCLELMEKIEKKIEKQKQKELEAKIAPRKQEKVSTAGIGKRCKNCNKIIEYATETCPFCGYNSNAINKQEPFEIPTAQLWGIIGMVIFFIVIILGCLIW